MGTAEHLVRPRFRGALAPHPGGGLHLDALAVVPAWRRFVSDADEVQYGGRACSEVSADPAGPADPGPGEVAPHADRRYWLDDELAAGDQWAGYRHLAEHGDTALPVLQVGGRGTALVRWVRASGRTGVLLGPFDAELDHCRRLARAAGVVDRLVTVRAPAEAVPLATAAVGAAFAPGVLHHTDLALALPELRRVVAPTGAFATWDVWASPAYRLGVALMGKQEEIACRPLDRARLAAAGIGTAAGTGPGSIDVTCGGCLARYPLAALARLGHPAAPARTARWGLLDRVLCRWVPPLRWLAASTVSLHGRGGAVVDLREPAPVPLVAQLQTRTQST